MPLHLLLGFMTSTTWPSGVHFRRMSAGMSLNRRYSSRGCQIGPSVKVKPVPSCSISTLSSTSCVSLSDLTSTGTCRSFLGAESGPNLTDAPLLLRVEVERERVDAVALARRIRPVGEDVAEMGVAGRAAHLDPTHAVRVVLLELDGTLECGLVEARPAGARVVLRLRAEQLRPAGAAAVDAVAVVDQQLSRPGRLGGRLAQDRVAVGVERCFPLGFWL